MFVPSVCGTSSFESCVWDGLAVDHAWTCTFMLHSWTVHGGSGMSVGSDLQCVIWCSVVCTD